MKKAMVVLAILFLAVPLWAADKDDSKMQINSCPKTTMQRDCLNCHVAGNFKVKETAPDAQNVYPQGVQMAVINGEGHYYLEDIDSKPVKKFFDYLAWHGIKKAVMEIHSPGGSLFDGQRIVNMVKQWQDTGGTVEMRLYGMAFSAGFYVFVSGDKRLVSPDADLMWHELQSFEGFGFKISTPSDKEDAARILRHLQDVRNAYIATRGKLTKAEIDAKVNKKEWWMTGREAVRVGFADGFIK